MFNKRKRAIKSMLKQGMREVQNAEVMIEFYQWQIDNAPESASKENIGKLELKIEQMNTIIANNTRINESFKLFLKTI